MIINTGLNHCDTALWRTSHTRVNTCPSKLIPFNQWIKKHEKLVTAADQFFSSRKSPYDAMPAVWKHMSVDERRQVASLMLEFETKAEKDPSLRVWGIENVQRLMELDFVHYDDIHKLRACFLASKEDPSVFVDPTPPPKEAAVEDPTHRQLALDADYTGLSFAPSDLLQKRRRRIPSLGLAGPRVGAGKLLPNSFVT